jgi:hypothetical protein
MTLLPAGVKVHRIPPPKAVLFEGRERCSS